MWSYQICRSHLVKLACLWWYHLWAIIHGTDIKLGLHTLKKKESCNKWCEGVHVIRKVYECWGCFSLCNTSLNVGMEVKRRRLICSERKYTGGRDIFPVDAVHPGGLFSPSAFLPSLIHICTNTHNYTFAVYYMCTLAYKKIQSVSTDPN